MKEMTLSAGAVTLLQLRTVFDHHVPVAVPPVYRERMTASEKTVADIVAKGDPVYSINTGFGALARVRIEAGDFGALQHNLILSHAAGVGAPLDDDTVRLVLFLKINALAQGFSGVRPDIVDFLLALYHREIYPVIPEKGSVGASGDLAPLAHLSLPLIGAGQVRHKGVIHDAATFLPTQGLHPLTLGPKEGLALLNGTQISTALALRGLFATENVFAAAVTAGAMSVDAAKGSTTPFDDDIHVLRRQRGQRDTAALYRKLLQDSDIRASHAGPDDDRVQDPYCLRCMPQVMGACLDHMRFAAEILENEANAVTDNPLVFAADGTVKSGGNFHAEPVAMASDVLALAIAEIGNMSERRTAMLIDHKMSGLPAFLVQAAGVNSGFMIAHVTAAALASENKSLAHPASVDTIPTSANQEDHVSMATFAARRLSDMTDNAAHIVAIELLAAAQGIDFHAPLKTGTALQGAHREVRRHAGFYERDRFFAPDIAAMTEAVGRGAFAGFAGRGFLPSMP